MAGFINVRISLYVRRARDDGPRARRARDRRQPHQALVLSQVVLSFGIPFALIPLVMLTSRRDVMGVHVNRALTTRRRVGARGADHRAERRSCSTSSSAERSAGDQLDDRRDPDHDDQHAQRVRVGSRRP